PGASHAPQRFPPSVRSLSARWSAWLLRVDRCGRRAGGLLSRLTALARRRRCLTSASASLARSCAALAIAYVAVGGDWQRNPLRSWLADPRSRRTPNVVSGRHSPSLGIGCTTWH